MIKINNLVKKYLNGENNLYAVNKVTFTVEDEEFLVILGPSGSGKSTLMNLMSGLDTSDQGKIIYENKDISKLSEKQRTKFRRDEVGFIFQGYYLMSELNVLNNIRMGANLVNNRDFSKIIQSLGLDDLLDRMPHQLSGGQQQRVAIARALAKRPKYLFCDEPTGALDEKTSKQVLKLLIELQEQLGFSIIMVTHNAGIADIGTKVMRMKNGEIEEIYQNTNKKSVDEIRWG
ncbi:ABC transporter ATP-binding protein [Enterococcus sp. CWB-B31]|uniref:ABC transporter ATP-binding protein n=1 Tax=Enterococcus sp. CWB-B31 TaxID=2885159 RepID=UPI001E57DC2E|nr:ABC transporter ATP-binding protein [Enterococcus sp. CWB-B31]MCB5953734.1 ABC transporter ATP-binding protein [Enterococcus sp. CWB-B31]